MITEPTLLFALLAATVGGIFWLAEQDFTQTFFKYVPPIIWVYYVPMLYTTFGLTPDASETYGWMTRYLLPVALFLLMITVDVPAIIKLGKMAIIMMLAGTAGIVIGGPIAFLIFGSFLDENAWMGFGGLAGSWIGGTANMVAVLESIEAPADVFGPAIVVDTIVGYGWIGILLYFSAFQDRFDKWIGADTSAIEETNARLAEMDRHRRPLEISDLMKMLGLAFGVGVLSILAGDALPALGDPTIISKTAWAVIIVVTIGLVFSFTPLQSDGACGRIKGRICRPVPAAGGHRGSGRPEGRSRRSHVPRGRNAVWISIHVGILMLVAKWIKAPLFFVATGSSANVGGAVSAPIVAGVYHRAMAPIGLLMSVSGYILGIYAALFCAYLLSLIAT